MSLARYDSGTGAIYSGTVIDADGDAIPSGDLVSLTLTLRSAKDNSVINSRNVQNVLNANNVSIDSNGTLVWEIQPEDTTVGSGGVDDHIAQFIWTWSDGGVTRTAKVVHTLRCVKYVPLCTYDDVEMNLADISADDRILVEALIESFSVRFEKMTNRKLEKTTVTEIFSPIKGQQDLRVSNYPITSVTSVKQDADGDFTGTLSEIDTTAYDAVAGKDEGIVSLRYMVYHGGAGTVQIVYNGGLIEPMTGVNAATNVPWDLKMAAIRQVAYMYQRRDSLGVTSESVSGGSVSIQIESDLLCDVKSVIDSYKPVSY